MTTDSWTFCHRCARMIWMSEIFSVGICAQQPRLCQTRCTPYQPVPNSTETELPRHARMCPLLCRLFLLPLLRTGDLSYLAVHEDAGEIQLDLEADVHVGAINRRRPPQREAPVGDLIETAPLRIRQLLVLCADADRLVCRAGINLSQLISPKHMLTLHDFLLQLTWQANGLVSCSSHGTADNTLEGVALFEHTGPVGAHSWTPRSRMPSPRTGPPMSGSTCP